MILTIVLALLVLSLLILVHEIGHFLVAKKAGIKIEEFGLGYPPRMVAKKIGETVYSLNWILFGGFVKLYGEELEESKLIKDKKRSFWSKSKKARAGVIVAGVLANFLLAIVCFSIVYSFAGIPTKTEEVRVVGLVEEAPGIEAGLKEGDVILSVDETEVKDIDFFIDLVEEKKGQEVKLKIEREEDNPCLEENQAESNFSCQEDNLILSLVPREEPPEGEGALGILISEMEMKKYPLWQMPFYGTREGFKEAFAWTGLVIGGVGKMFGNLATKGQIPKDIAGPVGILQITSTVAQSGLLTIIQFIGVLSINLAVLNILPFPALDGGRLLFIGYELITGRKPKAKIEQWVNFVGLTILMFLLVLVTVNDVRRIVATTSLGIKLRSLLPF